MRLFYPFPEAQTISGVPRRGIFYPRGTVEPRHIVLTGDDVAEDAAVSTVVGIFSVVGVSGSPVYVLTGTGGGKFSVSGDVLQVAGALDYETANQIDVTVTVSGVTPALDGRTFTIFVSNVDESAPTITSDDTISVNEGEALVHLLTANETVTWGIIGGADAAQFEVSGTTLRWIGDGTQQFAAPADADLNNTYVVEVRATDLSAQTSDQTITVTVLDVVEDEEFVHIGTGITGF